MDPAELASLCCLCGVVMIIVDKVLCFHSIVGTNK